LLVFHQIYDNDDVHEDDDNDDDDIDDDVNNQ